MPGVTYRWLNASGGDWTTSGNWDSPGFPNSGSASAIIATSGSYTVTLGGSDPAITLAALSLTDPSATVSISTASQNDTVQGDVADGGVLRIANSGSLGVGGSVTNTGDLELVNSATVSVTGDLTNSGFVGLDFENFSSEGGSNLTLGGTLTDSGGVQVGITTGMSAGATLTAGALVQTGSLTIQGDATHQSTLDVLSAAPTVLSGNTTLNTNALEEFASGQIGSIAANVTLRLNGAQARIADASDTTTDSALTGLTSLAGTLGLVNGATLSVTGDLTDSGFLGLDFENFSGEGGSKLTVGGTLTDSGGLQIGITTGMGAVATLTAGALAQTGNLTIQGDTLHQSILDVLSAAPTVLSGNTTLNTNALEEFASGQIGSIAANVTLRLNGAQARIADASDTTTDSALTGLASLAGTLGLVNGATVSVTGDLTDSGFLGLDFENFSGEGGSKLTVGGTLTDSGGLQIGITTGMGAVATLTAGALAQTGNLTIQGDTLHQSILDVLSAAPTMLSGNTTLNTNALEEFASGQIGSIAANVTLRLNGAQARIADASDTTTDSALTGLASLAGTLGLVNGATVSVTGDLTDSGFLGLDFENFSGEGGSKLTVGGKLTDSGGLQIGITTGMGAVATVTAGALAQTGNLTIQGDALHQSTLDVLSAAPTVLSGNTTLNVNALEEFASGQIGSIAANVTLRLNGAQARIADASDTTTDSALTGLASLAGTLGLVNGATVSVTGDLTDSGFLGLDFENFSGEGGSKLTVGGTLTDSGGLQIGITTGMGAVATLTAGALAQTGNLTIQGDALHQSTLDVLSAAPTVLSGNTTLDVNALEEFAGGQIGTIAAGASLRLNGPQALIADASNTTSNSALTGLTSLAGSLALINGATVAVTGDLTDSNFLGLDSDNFSGEGGSKLTVGGTLTDNGTLLIGIGTGMSALTTLTAGAFAGSGNLTISGDATHQTTLDVLSAAPTVLSGSTTLNTNALEEFASGQIGTIAAGASLRLNGPQALIADAADTTTSSALGGLTTLAGSLALVNGAAVKVAGNLVNTNFLGLDPDNFSSEGGSSLTVSGTLTNNANITIGFGTGISAGTTLSAGALNNTGAISLIGGSAGTAVISVGAASNSGSLGIGNDATLVAASFSQSGGTTGVTGTLLAAGGAMLSGGALGGTGTVAATLGVLGGTVFGGASTTAPGTLAVGGSFLESGGVLEADIAGTGAGQASLIAATGGATLNDGTLAVDPVNGFALAAGETFNVLTFAPGQLAGTFGALSYGGSVVGGTSSLAIGNGLFLRALYNNASGDVQVAVTATNAPPPTVTAPPSEAVVLGTSVPVTGIDVSTQTAGDVSVQISDTTGSLSTAPTTGVTVSGGGNAVTLSGGQTSVNQALQTLVYTPNGGAASDTIDVVVTDASLQTNSALVPVAIDQPPSITLPTSPTVPSGKVDPISGIVVNRAASEASQTLTVTATDAAGLLGATASGAGTVAGAGTANLTLTGNLADINAELASLTFDGTASDALSITVNDGHGGQQNVTLPVTVQSKASPPPTIATASAADNPGVLAPIDGISVADGAGVNAGTSLTVTLKDTQGLLGLELPGGGQPSSGATVTGLNTNDLTLAGTSAQINQDLAALTFLSSAKGSGSDTIQISAIENGATATSGFSIFGTSLTAPALLEFTGQLPPAAQSNTGGQLSQIGGLKTFTIGMAPGAQATQFAVGTQNNNAIAITANFAPLPFAPSQGFSTLSGAPEGVPPISLNYLLTASDMNPQPGDTVSYIIKATAADGSLLPDDRLQIKFGKVQSTATPFPSTNTTNGKGPTPYIITPSGGSFPKSVIPKSRGGSLTTHLHEISPTIYPPPQPPPGGHLHGDVHITTFDGLNYNDQAVGEFLLAKSTAPGDTFEVQVRTQPYFNGSAASVTTEVGAAIGAHRVTFDLFRTDTVWVDGAPVNLVPNGTPLELGAGTLQQLTATSWELRYDSGETVTVNKYDLYLDVDTTLTPRAKPGTVQGLLGSDRGNLANEFTLPNGTVLPQPLSYTDLYTTWSNAWRLTQADSLLDYGAGQTTASFTDLNFPNNAVPISAFPAALIAQAQSLVAAAGIKDPGAAQNAVEDYLLTGDPSFINGAGVVTRAIAVEPPTPSTGNTVGIAAATPTVAEAVSGPTGVVFDVFRTGDTSQAAVVDYQVQSPDASYVQAGAFAGNVLPSGSVTIAAGASLQPVTITLASGIGAVPEAKLRVAITPENTATAIAAPSAIVAVAHNPPIEGTPGAPAFINLDNIGTLTQAGSIYTLDLGTVDLGSVPRSVRVALANQAPANADAISGRFNVTTSNAILLTSGFGPITNLGGGNKLLLTLALDPVSVGQFTDTINFAANDSNLSGFMAALGTVTLDVSATVGVPAEGSVSPTNIAFGVVHQGQTVQQSVTVTNPAATAAALDASAVSTAGDATASGQVTGLAAGATDSADLLVGLNTATDGVKSGSVTVGFSGVGGAPQAAAPLLQPVSVTGAGTFTNSASLLADEVTPLLGTPDTSSTVVSWTDPATTFTYDLGSVQDVAGAFASLDDSETYVISASTDGTTFAPLFTITPGLGAITAAGVLDRFSTDPTSPFFQPKLTFAPTEARFIRLQGVGTTGTFAAGELDLFGPRPTVAVTGTVYALAQPNVSVASPTVVHVNDPGVLTLAVSNGTTADPFAENLLAQLLSGTGGFTSATSGPTGDIAPGASNSSLTLDFNTSTAGVASGNAVLGLVSDGTGVDTLGTTALPNATVPLSVTVDNFANPAFEATSGGTFSGSGTQFSLNLGIVQLGGAPLTAGFGVLNNVAGPADVLSGSLASNGAAAITIGGLGSFSGLGAGGTYTVPTVSLATGTAGTFTQTVTLAPTGSNASGYTAVLPSETLTVTGTVAALPPPVITVASTLTAFQTEPMLVGLSVSDPNTITQPITVSISDTVGTLTTMPDAHVTVGGNGKNSLVLTGDLADVNAELSSLTYTEGTLGNDSLNITVTDQYHAHASSSVAVTTVPVPLTQAILNGPTTALAVLGAATAINGLSISDPGAVASGETITLTFSDPGVMLTAHGNSGAVVTGQGTGFLSITGTVPQINAFLSDDIEYTQLIGLLASAGIIGKQTASILKVTTPEGLVTAVGGPTEAKFFEVGVENASFELLNLIGLIPGNTPPDFNAHIQRLKEIIFGKPEMVLPDGSIYNLEAAGEFILSASTLSGDSFLVEARIQPLTGSGTTSQITQVAAQLGNDRVTFGVGRSSVVNVDGTAAALSQGIPLNLSGGEVTQTSATEYQVTWNTGEVLDVTTAGSYLNVKIAPGANNPDGSLVGLINNGANSSNDFTLPDGTTLTAPLSSSDLQTFINAWRVPQTASLLDYGPGQNTTTFTDPTFATTPLTLADLPAKVVASAATAVAATGITDPGAVQAMELAYIASGDDPKVLADEANLFTGIVTAPVTINPSGAAPVVLGVVADQPIVQATGTTTTPVVFDAYLTGASATNAVVDFAVVAAGAGFLDASAFGGTLPSNSVTIQAGQTIGQFTIDLPANALGKLPTDNLEVQISTPSGTGLINDTAQATINQPIEGPPPVPMITDLTNLGTFSHEGNNYTLNLGTVQYGEPLPAIQFAIENAGSAGVDNLGGTFDVPTVAGFSVAGASLPQALGAGQSYDGLNVSVNYIKFGQNEQTVTFAPTDSNATGFSAPLPPITLTVLDNIVPPTMIYSYAYGDVHIITYNGTYYNFQAEGEFTLAKSRNPGDSFDIQLRLQPASPAATVTWITQVAVSVGTDRITFDPSRAALAQIDGAPTTISLASPVVHLTDGTLTEISSSVFRVDWNTGETMTVTTYGNHMDVADGIPLAEPESVGGLQGEDAGQPNDFQLSDGTVLQQPLSTTELYGPYANSWRVSQASSLFDYLPGQSTATFTDTSFPHTVVSLSDLPANLVQQAASIVAAAGITDPNIAAGAELDYLSTGDKSYIASAADVAAQAPGTSTAPIVETPPSVPAAGVEAATPGVVESASGTTPVVFDAYLTTTTTSDTPITYTVVDGGTGFLGTGTFGAILPSGTVTIAAGQTLAPFTIDVPQNALGTNPSADLEVQIASPGGDTLFAPNATATITNNVVEPGSPPIPLLAELSNVGTLVQNGNDYTLDLGELTQGETVPLIQLAVYNEATPPADSLSGTFSAPTGSGFIVIGNHLSAAIGPGMDYSGLDVGALTSSTGTNTEELTFLPRDVNDSGFMGTLAPITLTIKDNVGAPAAAQLNTPSSVDFPNVRVGTTDSHAISITNSAVAPADNLDVTASAFGDGTVTGAVTGLAPSQTDATDIVGGLITSNAGMFAGIVQLTPASDLGAAGSTPLATTINVDEFGSVYRPAAPSISPVDVVVHMGDPGSTALDITNTATADGFSENLIASLAGVTSGLGIAAAGPTNDIAPGVSDTASLLLSFSTTNAGTVAGTATVDLVTDGGVGAGSIDGLGQLALTPDNVPVNVTIDNFATAAIEAVSGPGTLSHIGNAYTLDLGTVALASTAPTETLGVLNAATGPADALSGGFTLDTPNAIGLSGFTTFSGLGAQAVDGGLEVTLDTSDAGSFSRTIKLTANGSNASGYVGANQVETLTITGTVASSLGINAPAAITARLGTAVAVSNVSLNLGSAKDIGQDYTVTVSDTFGLLSVQTVAGGGAVSGQNSTKLTIAGTLSEVDASLATLADADPQLTPDTITIAAIAADGTQATPDSVLVGHTFMLTKSADTVIGGPGPDVVVATSDTLSAGDTIAGNGGADTLTLTGAGRFDLRAPTQISGIGTIAAQEGQSLYGRFPANNQIVTLRDGMDSPVIVSADTAHNSANPKPSTITVVGAHNMAPIFLASGNDTVIVGDARESVHGGSGNDTIIVDADTIAAQIDGGTGTSTLNVTGGGLVFMGGSVTHISNVVLTPASTPYNFTANALVGIGMRITDNNTGADTLTAGGAGETLTGGGAGVTTFIGSSARNDTFANTAALFNGDTVQNFLAPHDIIDITDIADAGVSIQFTPSGAGGVLNVSASGHSAAIKLTGAFSVAGFTHVSDGNHGVAIGYTGQV